MSRTMKKPIDKRIGMRLNELRTKRKLSLKQVAEQLNPHVSIHLEEKSGETRISAIENSTGNLTPELAIAYSKTFDVSLEYIFCLSDDMQPENKTVKEVLGLTDEAISKIVEIKNFLDENNLTARLQILNILFESGYMMELLEHLYHFVITSRFLNKCVVVPLDDGPNDTEFTKLVPRWRLDKRVSTTIEKITDLLEKYENLAVDSE